MDAFEITIQRQAGDGWPVVVEQRTSGAFLPVRAEGRLRVDEEALQADALEPQAYGAQLGRALFADGVRDAFVQALAKSADRLHVLLFVEDPALRRLRWERLCVPLDGGWPLLALNQRLPFSHYLPSLTDRRFPPIGRRDLRALILAASPAGLSRYKMEPFDVAAAVTGVQKALGPIPFDVLSDLDGAAGPPSLDALCARLTAEHYTLLHVVCHGKVVRDGETVLYLAKEDDPQQVHSVTGTKLIERLSALQGARGLPHCVFLSSCETASAEAEAALGGLGQRLVRD
ncbi:MAG TPA: CHAT domain-containing protein, partial [Roseiflexaceae bacterium]|nr:CHAT domain-containing protein [Roseiflexaceae bacterium]